MWEIKTIRAAVWNIIYFHCDVIPLVIGEKLWNQNTLLMHENTNQHKRRESWFFCCLAANRSRALLDSTVIIIIIKKTKSLSFCLFMSEPMRMTHDLPLLWLAEKSVRFYSFCFPHDEKNRTFTLQISRSALFLFLTSVFLLFLL